MLVRWDDETSKVALFLEALHDFMGDASAAALSLPIIYPDMNTETREALLRMMIDYYFKGGVEYGLYDNERVKVGRQEIVTHKGREITISIAIPQGFERIVTQVTPMTDDLEESSRVLHEFFTYHSKDAGVFSQVMNHSFLAGVYCAFTKRDKLRLN